MKVHLTSCKFNPVKCLRCGTQVVTQDIDVSLIQIIN